MKLSKSQMEIIAMLNAGRSLEEGKRTNEPASSPQQPVVPQRQTEDAEQSGVVVQGDNGSPDRAAVDVPQSAIDLLPCPFCGEQAIEDEYETDDGDYRFEVNCTYCNASVYSYTSLKRAIKGWNVRAKLTPDEQGSESR